MGPDTVTIYVGPHRQGFVVRKDLLCKAAEFFNGAFCTEFKEVKVCSLDMPEDSPTTFSIFVEWLYQGAIPNGHSESYVDGLYELYLFAEKICMISPDLENIIMDRIQDISRPNNLLPKPATVRKVFQNAVEYSFLKIYCVQALVFDLKRENRQVVLGRRSFMDTFKQELDGLFELCKDDKELFKIFVWELHFKNNLNEAAVDPRRRDDSRPNDRCRFHGHGRGICHRDRK
jgi:hypothetical protein